MCSKSFEAPPKLKALSAVGRRIHTTPLNASQFFDSLHFDDRYWKIHFDITQQQICRIQECFIRCGYCPQSRKSGLETRLQSMWNVALEAWFPVNPNGK